MTDTFSARSSSAALSPSNFVASNPQVLKATLQSKGENLLRGCLHMLEDLEAGAARHEGSWWNDWVQWIAGHSGPPVPARHPGDGALRPLERAPGSYVRVRLG